MTQRTYDNIQGALTYAVLASGTFALLFWLDSVNLIAVGDYSEFGYQVMPKVIGTLFVIFGLAVIAKVWGAWVHNRFWFRVRLADKLHNTAYKIDPRRK
jgi:hypothetical protein